MITTATDTRTLVTRNCPLCKGNTAAYRVTSYTLIRCLGDSTSPNSINGCGLRVERKGEPAEVVAWYNHCREVASDETPA